MAPLFPLVGGPCRHRVRLKRLIEVRGYGEADARARISAQATDAQRRLVADIWLDNAGTEGEPSNVSVSFWYSGSNPFAQRRHPQPGGRSHRDWSPPTRLGRIRPPHPARLNTACGHRALRIDHRIHRGAGLDARTSSTFRSRSLRWTSLTSSRGSFARAGYPRARVDHCRRSESRRPQHRRGIRSKDNRLWHKRFMHRPIPGAHHPHPGGWPKPAICAAVPGLVERKPRRQGRLSGDQTHRGRTPRHRSVRRRSPGSRGLSASVELGDATGWSPVSCRVDARAGGDRRRAEDCSTGWRIGCRVPEHRVKNRLPGYRV